MGDLLQVDLRMNGYLFGSIVLLGFWVATLIALHLTGRKNQLPEFWWASIVCSLLGVTEFLFVPEYWDPPSILKFGDWDLESFLFCFATGGIAAVVTELPKIKRVLVKVTSAIERGWRAFLMGIRRLSGNRIDSRLLWDPPASRIVREDQRRIENMLLVTFFLALLGATSHFGINIIYSSAVVCVGTAAMIAWRRPRLRWQILGGAVTFLLVYGVVLQIVDLVYPDFYDHWNHAELSGIWFLGAPIEEYMFAVTFGMVWAPFFEAWMEGRDERGRRAP